MGYKMKTILVVDDDEMNLRMAEFILQQEGYNVVKVSSGMSCLEHLKYDYPDLILLDVEMPMMSGIQTLEVIRANEDYKNIPVMFLTASADAETVAEASRLGVLSYVKKPFMPNELVERVQNILRF